MLVDDLDFLLVTITPVGSYEGAIPVVMRHRGTSVQSTKIGLSLVRSIGNKLMQSC